MITGFKFFTIYKSLHLHFTSSFDITKYGSNSKTLKIETYKNRHDRYKFESFSNKLNSEKESYDFCLANFVHNSDDWIYKDFKDSDAIYKKWKGYTDGFLYRITNDYKLLESIRKKHNIALVDMFKQTKSGNHPPLLQLYLHKKVSPEFVCTLEPYFNFLEEWDTLYKNTDPYLGKQLFLLTKYVPLCKIIKLEKSSKSEYQKN